MITGDQADTGDNAVHAWTSFIVQLTLFTTQSTVTRQPPAEIRILNNCSANKF